VGIRFLGGQGGDPPTADDLFPIPDDNQGSEFSASLLISSKVLVRDLLQPALLETLGNGLSYSAVHESNQLPWGMNGASGGVDYRSFVFRYVERRGFHCTLTSNSINFPFAAGKHRVSVDARTLSISWRNDISASFHRKIDVPGWWDDNDNGT
jgi:hypothetical protein